MLILDVVQLLLLLVLLHLLRLSNCIRLGRPTLLLRLLVEECEGVCLDMRDSLVDRQTAV